MSPDIARECRGCGYEISRLESVDDQYTASPSDSTFGHVFRRTIAIKIGLEAAMRVGTPIIQKGEES